MSSNIPRRPKIPIKEEAKRCYLLSQFPELGITSTRYTTCTTTTTTKTINNCKMTRKLSYCIRGCFSRGWPPSYLRCKTVAASSNNDSNDNNDINPDNDNNKYDDNNSNSFSSFPFTLRMSQDYRIYPDRWRIDNSIEDQPADVSDLFKVTDDMTREISEFITRRELSSEDLEGAMIEEMALAVFGSNNIERAGLELDETVRLCMAVFAGEGELEYSDRSDEYVQALERYISRDILPGEKAILRSRREVVQHAAAFQHLISAFVKHSTPLTEAPIKSTHKILVRGLSAAEAGVLSSQDFGGVYRVGGNEKAFAGAHEFVKPSAVPRNMRSMVEGLQRDLAEVERSGVIDPYMLAAKYCDRFVNIHPFKDGNGRMCRMILNAILIKYAGIVVTLGEKDMDREEYLFIAAESGKVGGHPGQLGKLVLEAAEGSFRRLKSALTRHKKIAKEDD